MENAKGYKAFAPGMICRGKQYAENTDYEEAVGAICGKGMMHYCVNPFDTLNFYDLVGENGKFSDFAEVEALDPPVSGSDGKFAAKKLHIGAKLSFAGFVKACIDYTKEQTIDNMPKSEIGTGDSAQIGSSGDYAKIGSSGYYAKIGSSGNYAQIGSSGYYAKIGSSGYYAQIGSSGNYAKIGSSGDSAQIGSSGYYAKIGSSGDSAQIGSSGDYAQIGSSGDSAKIGSSGNSAQIGSSGNYAKINSTGEDSVICCAGSGSVVKAKAGSWITLAEWEYSDEKGRFAPRCVKTEYVDGEKIKADTWYRLKNGEFEEVR
nr:MAG TPA: hypothetical protein [Caudoviricetes sp.]